MRVLVFIVKLFLLCFYLLEDLAFYVSRSLDKIIQKTAKLLLFVVPIIVYNIIDNVYSITPKLTIYIMGVVNICLNFMSTVT